MCLVDGSNNASDREAKLREMLMKTGNMRQRMIAKLALLLFGTGLMAVGQPAGAISIYSETFTPPNTGTQSDAVTGTLLASDFAPDAGGNITNVVWQGMYNNGTVIPDTDDFTISFYEDDGFGSVGQLIASVEVGDVVNRVATGASFGDSLFYEYEASIDPGIEVITGSIYWISIVNDTALLGWYWAAYTEDDDYDGPGAPPYWFSNGSWVSYGYDYAYFVELSGVAPTVSPVPLPPTLALMLPGLALLGFMARRRKAV